MFPMEEYNEIYSNDLPQEYYQKSHRLHLFQDVQSQQLETDERINKLIPPKRIRRNYWKPHENRLYLQFLQDNQQILMKSIKQRTDLKVNVKMSQYVKSRTAKQCRSHHQKMIGKYESVSKIIKNLRMQVWGGSKHSDLKVSDYLKFQIMFQKAQDYQYNSHNEQFSSQNLIVILRSTLQ